VASSEDIANIEPGSTALLMMDMQPAVLAGGFDGTDTLIERLAGVRAAARARAVQSIFVRVGFRSGYPEISPRNKTFSQIAAAGRLGLQDPAASICPDLAPEPDDIVVTKHRVSGFHATDLDQILRSKEIDTIILSGVATSGVVLSTLRAGADLDYRCLVVSDGCIDRDELVHDVLVNKVFPRQAHVLNSAALIQALRATASKEDAHA
jgi:nicotinamidase-related amidase